MDISEIIYVESRDTEVWVYATDNRKFRNKNGITQWENLLGEDFVSTSILVVEMSSEAFSYYGRMNTALWDWMKKIEGR